MERIGSLPEECVNIIFTYVNPSWLHSCSKTWRSKMSTKRTRLIQWFRLRRRKECYIREVRDMRETHDRIMNMSNISSYKDVERMETEICVLKSDMAFMRKDINRIHHRLQVLSNLLQYPMTYIESRWNFYSLNKYCKKDM
jgi:hypothetical protein